MHTNNLVPRLYLAAVEISQGKLTYLHGCEIKSGWRPGYEVTYKLHNINVVLTKYPGVAHYDDIMMTSWIQILCTS